MAREWNRETYEREALELVRRATEIAATETPTDEMRAEAKAHLAVVQRWTDRVGKCWGREARAALHMEILSLSPAAGVVWVGFLSCQATAHENLMATIVAGVPFAHDGQTFKAVPEDFE